LKDYADAGGDKVNVFAESFHSSEDTKPDGTQKKDLGEVCSLISQCLLTLKHSKNRD